MANHVPATHDQILRRGLDIAGFDYARQNNVMMATNLEHFHQHYGVTASVLAQLWTDLQTTDIEDAKIPAKYMKLDYFLMTLHFLKRYKIDGELAGMFKVHEETVRDWIWYFQGKIANLAKATVKWPDHWMNDDATSPIFIVSVDGVHCRIQEPKHPTLSKNPDYYSHKFETAGLAYELAINLYTKQLAWINGPFPAGTNDAAIFRAPGGLMDKLRFGGGNKKGIADEGYVGVNDFLSTRNALDMKEVGKFKARAKCRHESYNRRIKAFMCMDERFRHGVDKHWISFTAVCVLCQYQLNEEESLFDL